MAETSWVVILHEIVHKLYQEKSSGAIFNIGYKKVYDFGKHGPIICVWR